MAELVARGHVFKTHSDTEVIVHGWEEWGAAVVDRLRGMFVFALWDRKRQTFADKIAETVVIVQPPPR